MELIRITTRDGFQLDGAVRRATTSPQVPFDAALFVHGTGGNFYNSSLFDFVGAKLLELGVASCRINTRGHDGISNAQGPKGGVRLGAAFETVDDCRHDLLGWASWLRQHIGPRILLVGHSMGAVKSLYATGQESDLDPAAVIAFSPPRLSYEWFCSGHKRDDFLMSFSQAEQAQAANQPAKLLEVKIPLPMIISAGGYLDKYGPEERYNYTRFVKFVRCPTLMVFGAIEVDNNVAFQSAPETIAAMARPNVAVRVIPNGDHFYSGVREETWARVNEWLPK